MNLQIAAEQLCAGNPVTLKVFGNSMTPLIQSGDEVTISVLGDDTLKKGDIVLAKVKGRYYLHKVSAIQGKRVQISNNHGFVNGWTTIDKVFGILE